MEPWMWIIGLIVLGLIGIVASRAAQPKRPTTTTLSNPAVLDAAARAEIDALVASGQKILAIKRLREASSMGLAEAKNRIDTWNPASAIPRAPDTAARATVGLDLPDGVRSQIDLLVAQDKKIQAIKVFREHTGRSLQESKDAIDAWG